MEPLESSPLTARTQRDGEVRRRGGQAGARLWRGLDRGQCSYAIGEACVVGKAAKYGGEQFGDGQELGEDCRTEVRADDQGLDRHVRKGRAERGRGEAVFTCYFSLANADPTLYRRATAFWTSSSSHPNSPPSTPPSFLSSPLSRPPSPPLLLRPLAALSSPPPAAPPKSSAPPSSPSRASAPSSARPTRRLSPISPVTSST
jgi:hypothetical protein